MNEVLSFLSDLAPLLLYGILGAGSALENLFPPVPADTFVLLGAFLASRGKADAVTVFFVTWLSNTLTALLVYWAGYRYGRPFFQVGMGRFLLNSAQLKRMGTFYRRWGLPAIFFARFLPGLRAMVPVFAGVTRQSFLPVAVPVLVASAIWYGGLVWFGAATGRNLSRILDWLSSLNHVLLVVAGVVFVAVGVWWFRTRRSAGAREDGREKEGGG